MLVSFAPEGVDPQRIVVKRSFTVFDAAGCEPLSEVGVCRSGELRGGELPSLARTACQPAVRAIAGTRRPRQRGGRPVAALGRSRVPRAEPPTGVSRADRSRGSDQRGVSATMS